MPEMDLFTPVVPREKLHPNFRVLLERAEEDRAVLVEWAHGFIDRDGKLVYEFQTGFNGAFWELYVFAVLKEFGFQVDFQHSSPDFVVTNFWNKFCVEASVAQNAKDKVAEWEWKDRPRVEFDAEAVLSEATVRLANTVSFKHKKYQEAYQRLRHVQNRPFVLAIAPFEQPGFYVQNDHAMRIVLYGYDRPVLPDQASGKVQHRLVSSVMKNDCIDVPVGYFTTDCMREISAVIFSTTATTGKVSALSASKDPDILFMTYRFDPGARTGRKAVTPKDQYKESLEDGLHVFHNPSALFPLDLSLFDRPGVTQYTWDRRTGLPMPFASDGSLIQRNVMRITREAKGKTRGDSAGSE